MRDNRRFQRGTAVYTCRCCHQQTRETGGYDAANVKLCAECYDVAGWENAVMDGDESAKAELTAALAKAVEKRNCATCAKAGQ